MKKKTLYNRESNSIFAKDNNLKKGMKYIHLLSNIDRFGKSEFTLWFYSKYFFENQEEWKGQSYYANVSNFLDNQTVVLESNFSV